MRGYQCESARADKHLRILGRNLSRIHHLDIHDGLVDKVAKDLVHMHRVLALEPGGQSGRRIVRKPANKVQHAFDIATPSFTVVGEGERPRSRKNSPRD